MVLIVMDFTITSYKENWDWSAKGDNPDRKHRSSRIVGGLGMGLTTPSWKNVIIQKPLGSQGQTERVVAL